MQIILLEQVEKLGTVGDIVEVRNGFARNFLIPTNKALRATKENKEFFEKEKAEIISRNNQIRSDAEKFYNSINAKTVHLIRHSSEEGKLYGSVMPRDIALRLSEYFKAEVAKRQIVQEKPIRELGLYTVKVRLHADFIADVTINVARTLDEAKANIAKLKKSQEKKSEEKKLAEFGDQAHSSDETKAEQANPSDSELEAN